MIDLIALYEDLKKYVGDKNDDLFYDAPEGEAQKDIVVEMLAEISDKIKR